MCGKGTHSVLRRSLTWSNPNEREIPVPEAFFLGAELDDKLIRAAVFDAWGRMLGKAKRSTKLERGREAVLQRLARCMRDAVDECDLPLDAIRGAGVGLAEAVARSWATAPVALAAALQTDVPFPVFVESHPQLATLGIHAVELDGAGGVVAAVFCGTDLDGGLVVAGAFPDAPTLDRFHTLLRPVRERLQAAVSDPWVRGLDKTGLRKAARHRDPRVGAYAGVLAEHTGLAVAQVCQACAPDRIMLGGPIIDELKAEMMPVLLRAAQRELGAMAGAIDRLQISELANNAVLVGGAAHARRQLLAGAAG